MPCEPTHHASIQSYLNNYGEVEAHGLDNWPEGLSWQRSIVLPAYNEAADFYRATCAKLSDQDRLSSLVIVVINRPDSEPDSGPSAALFATLMGESTVLWQHNNRYLLQPRQGKQGRGHTLVVDRFSQGHTLAAKQGVGLARKIGADIACALYARGHIQRPWLYSLDADAIAPDNYFTAENLANPKSVAAFIFNFKHGSFIESQATSAAISEATERYERAICYYADALKWAGSPYGFCTLGSAFAVNTHHYALARGFPKRPAGEDFYLLNKIAKIGSVQHCHEICIGIHARLSSRVPFGTGPAVAALLNNQDKAHLYYHFSIFIKLKQMINIATAHHCALQKIEDIPTSELQAVMSALKFTSFLAHAKKQCNNAEDWLKHFHQWFDAFKVLKFVHYLQEHGYAPQALEKSIEILKAYRERDDHHHTQQNRAQENNAQQNRAQQNRACK